MVLERIGNALKVVTAMGVLGLASNNLSAQTIDEIKAAKPGIERTTLLIKSMEASIMNTEKQIGIDKTELQVLKGKIDAGSADQDDKDEHEYLTGTIAMNEQSLDDQRRRLESLKAALKIFEIRKEQEEERK